MLTLIIIQLILAVLLIIFVLLQGSDNEGLGLGGGGGMGGMMSPRGSANLQRSNYSGNGTQAKHCGGY